MNKTLIIGASGKIGKMLATRLHDSGKPVVAMVRTGNKAQEFVNLGIDTAVGNLEENFESVFNDCDRVVFSAGSGAGTSADKTLQIDLWGACRAINLAKENNISHFIMVSSRGADNPDQGPKAIKPYLIAKHFADNHLIASGLNYTILRPGRLLDVAGTGLIQTNRPNNPDKQVISRDDTASAICYCLSEPQTIGKTYEIYQGDIPLGIALSSDS